MRKKVKRSRASLTRVYGIIHELAQLFGGECEVCKRKMKKPTSGFTIHHLEYRKNEKTHKDFISREKYYDYLKPIILKAKKKDIIHSQFAFLCNACHHSIDGPRGLKRRKRENVMRLFHMYLRTKT